MKPIDIQKPISYNQRLMSKKGASAIRLQSLVAAAMFAALTTIGAQIKIPLPAGVPITLQTFFVILSGYLLGSTYGPLAQGLYLFAGLIGFPVFTEGGGPAYIFKPTFGYLLGYPLASFTVARIVYRRQSASDFRANRYLLGKIKKGRLIVAGVAGVFTIFIPGVLYLYFVTNHILQVPTPFSVLVSSGFFIFLPGDVLKLGAIMIFLSFWAIKSGSLDDNSRSARIL